MKILFVITRSDVIGGASMHVLELIEFCMKSEISVAIAIGGDGMFSNLLKEKLLTVYPMLNLVRPLSPIKDIFALYELQRIVKAFEPDLIHAHSAKAGLLARICGKKNKIKTIYTVHGWPFTNGIRGVKGAIFKLIEKYMMYISDAIITVSEYDRQLAVDNNFPCIRKITVIQNGMGESAFERMFFSPTSGNLKFIMVARFDQQKNQELLIQAVSKLDSIGWVLEFVGDGPQLEYCKEVASKYGVAGRITFSGYTDNVRKKLSESDIFILTSNWEGLPLTIIEAMAEKMPIIASNVGGVSELITSYSNGFLIDDVDSIVASMKFYLDDVGKVRKHGQVSYAKYKKSFTSEMMVSKTVLVYKQQLALR